MISCIPHRCICIFNHTDVFVSSTTPSPTGLVNQSSAGVVAAGVLVPVIVLSLLAATAVVIVVIYRKPKGVYFIMLCFIVFFYLHLLSGLYRMMRHGDNIELKPFGK